MSEESKKDLFLKRVQVTIAILGGLATLIVGGYQIQKIVTGKADQPAVVVKEVPVPKQTSELQSALESTGASWIRKLSAESAEKARQQ